MGGWKAGSRVRNDSVQLHQKTTTPAENLPMPVSKKWIYPSVQVCTFPCFFSKQCLVDMYILYFSCSVQKILNLHFFVFLYPSNFLFPIELFKCMSSMIIFFGLYGFTGLNRMRFVTNIVSLMKFYLCKNTVFSRVWQPLCNMNATIIALKVF